MKNPLYSWSAAVLLFFSVSDSFAQGIWKKLNSGVTADLIGVSAPGKMICYAVGLYGTILKTTDGGENWLQQEVATNEALYSTYFLNNEKGFAVGDNEVIVSTVDGGVNWTVSTIPGAGAIRNIKFISNSVGFVVGGFSGSRGTLFKTTDGGNTWVNITVPGNTNVFYGLSFLNANVGYLTDFNGYIFKTSDGGATWTRTYSGVSSQLVNTYFDNTEKGVILSIGDGLLNTSNGGSDWTPSYHIDDRALMGVDFRGKLGFITGGNLNENSGIILTTVDGGINWSSWEPGCKRLNYLDIVNELDKMVPDYATTAYAVGMGGDIFKYGYVMGVSGINKTLPETNSLSLFPNPATTQVTFKSSYQFSGDPTVKVLDAMGRQVETIILQVGSFGQIDVSSLNSGVYFVAVFDGDKQVAYSKLVRE